MATVVTVVTGHRWSQYWVLSATQSHVVAALAHEFVVGSDQIPEAIVWMNIFITRLGLQRITPQPQKKGGKAAKAGLIETNAWHC